MNRIEGLITAPFTPFSANGEVNLAAIEAYATMIRKAGIVGVFVCGSSGEGYMLTEEERKAVLEKWISVKDDLMVIAHVGSSCLKESERLAAHAEQAGADAISTMAPPFPKIGRMEELVAYCECIANAAPSTPFYYYHIPVFNGAYFPMTDMLKAVDGRIANFVGIKYTYESLYDFNQCAMYKDGKYEMLHGQDETILNSLVMGRTKGGISGTGSYIGKDLVQIIKSYNEGDVASAVECQDYAQAVINIIAKYRGNIVAGKRIMKLIGLDLGKNRTPFWNLSQEEENSMTAELKSIGFFERCNSL